MKKLIATALICTILATSCSLLPQESGASVPTETVPAATQPAEESSAPVTSIDLATETAPSEETSETASETKAEEIATVDFDSCENLSYHGDENEYYSPIASEIITAFYNADTEYLCETFVASEDTVFDFVKGVKFNKICITGASAISEDYNSLTCIVEMDIDSTTSDVLPVGRSQWQMMLEFGAASFVQVFRPLGTVINNVNPSNYGFYSHNENDFGARMCYMITTRLTNSNVSSTPSNGLKDNFAQETDSYYSLILIRPYAHSSVIENNEDDYNSIKSGELTALAERLFGPIDGFDPTSCYGYDAETDSLTYPAKGGIWLYENVVSHTVDASTNTHTVVIEYYADSAYLVKAKTIEYTFTEDEDGYYGNVMQKLIFDGGFEMAWGTV